MRLRFFPSTVPLAVCLLAAGCATQKVERLDALFAGRTDFWQPHLLYCQSSPCSRMYVEVDAVEGCEPGDATLNKLKEFLTAYCEKPGGIEMVRSDVIPVKEAQGTPRYGLVHKFMNGPPERAGEPRPAFIYILFYDGALCDKSTASEITRQNARRQPKESEGNLNVYTEWLPYPAIVFFNVQYAPSRMRDGMLLHEAGHLLGLVHRPGRTDTLHCPDTKCQMTETHHLLRIFLGGGSTEHYPLCEKCVEELKAGETATPPTNLRFVGPVLVRSEAGYHVLHLPGSVRLIVGELVEQDCLDFAKVIRLHPVEGNARYADGQVKPELLKDAKVFEVLHRAEKDPFDEVRRLASRFERLR